MIKKIKQSEELNNLIDSVYDLYCLTNIQINFKNFMKTISSFYFENDYQGAKSFIEAGITSLQLSQKSKKPIYFITCSRINSYVLFVGKLSQIKSLLLKEKLKIDNKIGMQGIIKNIDALDASILAYIALAPKRHKSKELLKFLSKKNLLLGKCLVGDNEKFSKKVLKTATLYREWACYKKSTKTRQDLNVSKLIQ